jgi:hypothetical protein
MCLPGQDDFEAGEFHEYMHWIKHCSEKSLEGKHPSSATYYCNRKFPLSSLRIFKRWLHWQDQGLKACVILIVALRLMVSLWHVWTRTACCEWSSIVFLIGVYWIRLFEVIFASKGTFFGSRIDSRWYYMHLILGDGYTLDDSEVWSPYLLPNSSGLQLLHQDSLSGLRSPLCRPIEFILGFVSCSRPR